MSGFPVHEEGALRITARTFLRAPLKTRMAAALYFIYMAFALAYSIAVAGPRAWQEPTFWGGILGGFSGLLVGTGFILHHMAQEYPREMRWKMKVAPRQMHAMLTVFPAIAFAGGLMAAASAAMIVTVLEGAPRGGPFALSACLLVVFVAWKGFSASTRFLYRHAREQAAAAERARAEAADAQLAALRAQMNPHFLFNALNTIASLVRTDARGAEAVTENLARVLRRTLERTRAAECTLEDELDYLRAWLAVERERFGERLAVEIDARADVLPLRIPTMTLQPLVENSLKHGIAHRLEGGRITVRARRADGVLRLEVEDDGPGFAREPREGTGLANLRRRLETMYGEAATLSVDGERRGARVVVDLPAGAEG